MQIKSTLGFHLALAKMSKIKKVKQNTKRKQNPKEKVTANTGGDVGREEPSLLLLLGVHTGVATMEMSVEVP